MKKIAICGNIASGKSTVQKMLECKGFKVLDTDKVSHKLLTIHNKPLYEAFKNFDVFENGEFSRFKTGKLIFSDENARQRISEIMHPQIKDEILKFRVKKTVIVNIDIEASILIIICDILKLSNLYLKLFTCSIKPPKMFNLYYYLYIFFTYAKNIYR